MNFKGRKRVTDRFPNMQIGHNFGDFRLNKRRVITTKNDTNNRNTSHSCLELNEAEIVEFSAIGCALFYCACFFKLLLSF